jgi:hypothetical protein
MANGRRTKWSTKINQAVDNRDADGLIWALIEKVKDDLLIREDTIKEGDEPEEVLFDKDDFKFCVQQLVTLYKGRPPEDKNSSKKKISELANFIQKANTTKTL